MEIGIIFNQYQRTTYFTDNLQFALFHSCSHSYKKLKDSVKEPEKLTVAVVAKVALGKIINLNDSVEGQADNPGRKSCTMKIAKDGGEANEEGDSLMFQKDGCNVFAVYSTAKYYESHYVLLKTIKQEGEGEGEGNEEDEEEKVDEEEKE